MVVTAAPDTNASKAPSAPSTSTVLPNTRWSASMDRNPVMCEV